jgi:hypothetical protein
MMIKSNGYGVMGADHTFRAFSPCVIKVLQKCYSGVTVVLHLCCSCVAEVLQKCYRGFTVVLQGGHRDVTGCYSGVTVEQWCHLV